MLNIVILEDQAEQAERLTRMLEKYASSHLDFAYTLKRYERSIPLLTEYKCDADILFLDIQVPDMLALGHGVDAAPQGFRRHTAGGNGAGQGDFPKSAQLPAGLGRQQEKEIDEQQRGHASGEFNDPRAGPAQQPVFLQPAPHEQNGAGGQERVKGRLVDGRGRRLGESGSKSSEGQDQGIKYGDVFLYDSFLSFMSFMPEWPQSRFPDRR